MIIQRIIRILKVNRSTENILYLLVRLKHILRTDISNPKFYNPDTKEYESLRKEFSKKRKDGISGFMRIFNEEETIENVILSCIDGLDELVVCLNNCYDRTEEIVERLIEKYPDKIKLYRYEYDVYSARSQEHAQSKFNDVNNLANYYNYTLSKCNFKYAIKIDGDTLMIKEDFEKICASIRKNGLNEYLYLLGINLFEYNNKIYFKVKGLIIVDFDIGFFKISRYTYFLKGDYYEHLKTPYLKISIKRILYFHLKGLKKDKGLLNLSLSKKKIILSKDLKKIYEDSLGTKSFDELNLLTFSQLVEKYPEYKNLELPKEYEIER